MRTTALKVLRWIDHIHFHVFFKPGFSSKSQEIRIYSAPIHCATGHHSSVLLSLLLDCLLIVTYSSDIRFYPQDFSWEFFVRFCFGVLFLFVFPFFLVWFAVGFVLFCFFAFNIFKNNFAELFRLLVCTLRIIFSHFCKGKDIEENSIIKQVQKVYVKWVHKIVQEIIRKNLTCSCHFIKIYNSEDYFSAEFRKPQQSITTSQEVAGKILHYCWDFRIFS